MMQSRYLQEKGGVVGERNPGRPGILEVQVRLCLSTHMFLAFAPPECGAGQAGINHARDKAEYMSLELSHFQLASAMQLTSLNTS